MSGRDANQLAADATELRRRIDLLIQKAPQMDGPDWSTAMLPLAFEASKTLGDAVALVAALVARITDLEAACKAERQGRHRMEMRKDAAEAQVATLTQERDMATERYDLLAVEARNVNREWKKEYDKREAAEAALATARQALTEIMELPGWPLPHKAIASRALAATDSDSPPVSPFHTEPVPS